MVKSRKKFFIITAVVGILAVGIGYLYYQYCANNPYIKISHYSMPNSNLRLLNIEAYDTNRIPVSKSIYENILEFNDWNEKNIRDIYENFPNNFTTDIVGYGSVVDGKTILGYSGTAITKDGRQVDYFDEQVFDFVIVPDDELPKKDL